MPIQINNAKPSSVSAPLSNDAAKEVSKLIDISGGDLSAGAKELATKVGKAGVLVLASPGGMPSSVVATINELLENGTDYMTECQSSDPYSVSATVFSTQLANGSPAYGVWVGAPGDIGAARLVVVDKNANVVKTIDEEMALTKEAKKIVEDVRAQINLTSGEVLAGAKELEIDFDDEGMASVQGLPSGLSETIDAFLDNSSGYMHAQGSDGHSVALTVFEVKTSEGKAYGVWAGAPGDIGNARLVVVNKSGGLLATIDEQ